MVSTRLCCHSDPEKWSGYYILAEGLDLLNLSWQKLGEAFLQGLQSHERVTVSIGLAAFLLPALSSVA